MASGAAVEVTVLLVISVTTRVELGRNGRVALPAMALPLGVGYPVAPQELAACLSVMAVVSSVMAVGEAEVVNHIQANVNVVVVFTLVAGWQVVVEAVSHLVLTVRVSYSENAFLGDLTRVRAPRPQVVGPGAVLPAGVSLDVVDGAGWPDDLGNDLLRPDMYKHPFHSKAHADLQLHATAP